MQHYQCNPRGSLGKGIVYEDYTPDFLRYRDGFRKTLVQVYIKTEESHDYSSSRTSYVQKKVDITTLYQRNGKFCCTKEIEQFS